MIQNCPVCKEAVKEEIRKFQKAVHRNLKVCGDLNISKLSFEPPQFHLKLFDLFLRIVQFLILGKIGHQTAAHYVPCTPALGIVDGFENFVDRMQGSLSCVDGFQQLPLLNFQCGNAAFAFRNLLCGRVGRDFDTFDLFGKSSLILPFAIGQPCQPILNLLQVGINGRKVMESSIVLDTGCIGFLPFLVQLFVHFSNHLIEKCGKAVPLQTVHISLFCQLGFFQLFQTISKRISLGGQFFLLCFTAFLFCDLLPKFFQRRITHKECPFPALRLFVQKLVQKMLPIIYKCFGDNVAVRIFILTRMNRAIVEAKNLSIRHSEENG